MRIFALSLVLLSTSFAQEEKKVDARFEKLKKLAGDWLAEGSKDVAVTYRISAGGSTVVETLFPGAPHEMMSMYTMDGAEVRMTHYCVMGNQPSMKAGKLDGNKLPFVCDKLGGGKETDAHMHAAVLTFTDDDHLAHEWTMSKDGKDGEVKKFALVRAKK